MDVLPAHLNRDSFRDSFKGLVALEIIVDLPVGFPINNIISLYQNTPFFEGVQHQKKTGNALSDALRMSRFQNFAAGAAPKKPGF